MDGEGMSEISDRAGGADAAGTSVMNAMVGYQYSRATGSLQFLRLPVS